ncbi:nuclear transport factor 2 family protein [Maribacter aurantiacus]|uniref:nuclear transport factor 2 family protein n=1 Tax=Maribacter aurantiacus TaxID=1882343 RepID=UPI001F029E73|nr:nuclear transport factor 2 family protein [Maribacter aurantiacus]
MKRIVTTLFVVSTLICFGQSTDEDAVRTTVDEFFTAFHAQDSAGLANLVSEKIVLQTIGTGKEGKTILRQQNFEDFIRSIVSIPDSVKFREKLLDYSIQTDGAMANAWTPYEFWVNDSFSHCGVNSFQMVKQQGVWRIVYLIDTRRKEGCKGQPN